MAKRQKREEIDQDQVDLLIPIDISQFGTEDDPCFGKFHDLKAPECMKCGDADVCALAKAQYLHTNRIKIEGKQRFKDIEEADEEMIKKKEIIAKEIKTLKTKPHKRLKAILILSEKHTVPKNIVKQIYDQI